MSVTNFLGSLPDDLFDSQDIHRSEISYKKSMFDSLAEGGYDLAPSIDLVLTQPTVDRGSMATSYSPRSLISPSSTQASIHIRQKIPQLCILSPLKCRFPSAFDLSGSKLDDNNLLDRLKQQLNIVDNSRAISHLDLSHNSIDDVGIIALSQFLPLNFPELIYLNLSHNRFGNLGISAFVDVILDGSSMTQHHLLPPIRQLILSHNYISCCGISHIAKVLQGNTTLNTLKLKSNLVGIEGASKLALMLTTNKTLTCLDLSSNSQLMSDDESGMLFKAAMSKNYTLTHLNMYWADICIDELERNRQMHHVHNA